LAFIVTNIITFSLTRRYVFTSSRSKSQEQTLFVICLGGALLVNDYVLKTLVEYAAMDLRLAKIFAIGVTVIWNFFTRKYIVFRNRVATTSTNSDMEPGSEPDVVPEPSPAKDYSSKKF
jgi:putative flippase GtrA